MSTFRQACPTILSKVVSLSWLLNISIHYLLHLITVQMTTLGSGGHIRGMWKFPGQQSNLSCSSDPSCCSDKARSLTSCTARELLDDNFPLQWLLKSYTTFTTNPLGFVCVYLVKWLFLSQNTLNQYTVSNAIFHYYGFRQRHTKIFNLL